MRFCYLVAYVASIFIANLLIDKFIKLPVYGMLSAGTIFFAFVFTLRDHLHRYGVQFAIIGIIIALLTNTALSLLFNIPFRFVIASFFAIMLSELCDTAIFEQLKARSWPIKVLASNAVSIPIDSLVMTIIAFFGILTFDELLAIIVADVIAKYLISLSIVIRVENIYILWQKLFKKRYL